MTSCRRLCDKSPFLPLLVSWLLSRARLYQSQPLQPLGLQQSLPGSILGIAESEDFDDVFHKAIDSHYSVTFSATVLSPPGQHLASCGVPSGLKEVPAYIQHSGASATELRTRACASLSRQEPHQTSVPSCVACSGSSFCASGCSDSSHPRTRNPGYTATLPKAEQDTTS